MIIGANINIVNIFLHWYYNFIYSNIQLGEAVMWEDTLTRWFYFEELGIDLLYGNTISVPQIR